MKPKATLPTRNGEIDARDRWHPDWARFTQVCAFSRVEQGMDMYYKSDRLNRPGGTRNRLVADRQIDLEARGWTLLASHHDSAIGVEVYARQVGDTICAFVPTPNNVPGSNSHPMAANGGAGSAPRVTKGVVPGGVRVTIKDGTRDMSLLTSSGNRDELLAIADQMENDAARRLARAAYIRRGAETLPREG